MARYKAPRIGPTAQKVLVLLLGGLTLGLTTNPKYYFRVIDTVKKDWKRINENAKKYALNRAIKNLYQSKFINAKDNSDGTVTLMLTKQGKALALTYDIENIKIPPMKHWDGKWRIVLFDIPEKHKKARDALSKTLKYAGFYQFQKSVFVHPFECRNEVDFVIEFFSLRSFVRFILADHIDNEFHIKKHYNLI